MQNRFPPPTTTEGTDKILNCRDCKAEFTFSAREQAFYAENNYTPPRGCKPCRDARKAQRGDSSQQPAMAKPNGFSPGGPSPVVEYENRGGGGDRKDRGRRNRSDDFDSDEGGGYRRRR